MENIEETKAPPRWRRLLSVVGSHVLTTRAFFLLLATILTGSVCYYFVIALPAAERARLAFEKQKYEDAKAQQDEKEKAAADKESKRRWKVLECQIEADREYWDYVKLNGQKVPGKEDAWTAPQHIWENARRRKKDAYDECMAY